MLPGEDTVHALRRPHGNLLIYYVLASFLLGPLFFVALIPMAIRYLTLHYRFDSEGISMGWGVLFRREINLTYARIQDIHLRSNVVERYLGLARIEVQTASGSSGPELTIEGLQEFELVRDYLYAKMRGTPHGAGTGAAPVAAGTTGAGAATGRDPLDEITAALNAATAELNAIRVELARRSKGG